MGGGKSGGDTIIRYAPYLEAAHQTLIAEGQVYVNVLTAETSPYAAFTVVNPDVSFFGIGFAISDFPSLYDMFGKFMAGLDVETLHEEIMTDSIYDIVINDSAAAEGAYLTDQISTDSYPRLEAGARDINAVNSTGFIAARAQIEDTRLKAINKYKSDLKQKFAELGHRRWERHLTWNENVIKMYSVINQSYFQTSNAYVDAGTKIESSKVLWPFQVLDYQRAIVGALNGAAGASSKRDSPLAQALGITSAAIGLGGLLSGGGAAAAAEVPWYLLPMGL